MKKTGKSEFSLKRHLGGEKVTTRSQKGRNWHSLLGGVLVLFGALSAITFSMCFLEGSLDGLLAVLGQQGSKKDVILESFSEILSDFVK